MTPRKTKRGPGRPIKHEKLSPIDRRRLRAGREARGMTREALARVLGVRAGTLRAWEVGSGEWLRRPSAEALARWREAVGVDAPAAVSDRTCG